jgi:hypothetical protein
VKPEAVFIASVRPPDKLYERKSGVKIIRRLGILTEVW